ncbi:MAG: hypothetical protein ABI763_04185 [Bacteroidota bacterium]
MDTTINYVFTTAHSASVKPISNLSLVPFWQALERDRFGMTPVFLVLAACLGGFAAAVSVQHSLFILAIVGLSTGLVEVMLIAVAPMRITFWFLVAAVLIDLFVFIF